jgi:TonB-dependent SusC/RagA subfamily outer membrane receptor
MNATWLLSALLFSAALAAAAHALEAVLPRRLPRRWIWTLALAASVLVPAAAFVTDGAWPGDTVRNAAARVAALLPRAAAAENSNPAGSVIDAGVPLPVSEPAAAAGGATPAAELTRAVGRFPAAWLAALPEAWHTAFAAAWLAGSVLLLLGYVAFWLYLLGAASAWREARLCGRRVAIAPALGPAVFGLRRPAIVLPEWVLAAAPTVQRLVLLHELQHARSRDHVLLAVAPLAAVLMPWNVALWWQLRRLRLAVELDCDARVLARRVAVRDYGNLLIEIAGRSAPVPAPLAALAGERTVLERRILAMTAPAPRSRLRMVALSTAAAALLLCGVLAFGFTSTPASAAGVHTHPVEVSLATSAEAGIAAYEASSSDITSSAATSSEAASFEATSSAASSLRTVSSAAPLGVSVRPVAADTPIIVVDGVIVGAVELDRVLEGVRVAGIEVVKGAAAVAMFGERARNGAILISTPAAARPGLADEAEVARRRAVEAQVAAALERRVTGNDPLFVVDGVVVSGNAVTSNTLNTQLDVESIEIIKGPEAARLYGSRAANGVILITTKKKQ